MHDTRATHSNQEDPRLTWPQAYGALHAGAAEEVSDDLGYKYTVSASRDPLVNWGGHWQSPYSVIDLECRSFRISKPGRKKMEEQQPQPMSEADRRALRVALAEGKVCWIEWVDGPEARKDKFRLSDGMRMERKCSDGSWISVSIGSFVWLSWSEVREPRVFEFEVSKDTMPPGELVAAIVEGSRFKVRYEEILP